MKTESSSVSLVAFFSLFAVLSGPATAQCDCVLPDRKIWDDSTGVAGVVAFEFVPSTLGPMNSATVANLLNNPGLVTFTSGPFVITAFGSGMKQQIRDCMAVIEGVSGVRFMPFNPAVHDKHLTIRPMMPSAGVGGSYRSSDRTIRLPARPVNRSTVVHELMHALGFPHEQKRNDRDSFVTVTSSSVTSDWESQFTKKGWIPTDLPYDLESLMHYGPTHPTTGATWMTAVDPSFAGVMGQRMALTILDALKLEVTYGNPARPL